MKIKIEYCFSKKTFFRLYFYCRGIYIVERINHEFWDRKVASEVLTMLETKYRLKRKNIRFVYES